MAESTAYLIKVFDVLESPFAVSTEEGEKLFEVINKNLKANRRVEIDFIDIQLIVSTFLNASIGQLYGLYPTELIQEKVSLLNMSDDDLTILKKVTDRAKEYFKDKSELEDLFKNTFPNAE